MDKDFHLITLGRLALVAPPGADDAGLDRQRRKLAVLTVLALSPDAVSRDLLLEMFWGDQPEGRARHSLSDALSHVRRVLGPGSITARRADVALSPDAPLRVDAAELAEAVSGGDDESALRLYGGPFLEAVYVGGSPRFEQWVAGAGRRLERLFQTACERRCRELARAHEWTESEAVARRWLDSDPLSADAGIALLQAIAGEGDAAARVRALEAYDALRRRAAREFDVEPAAPVSAFAERLRSELPPVERVASEGEDARGAPAAPAVAETEADPPRVADVVAVAGPTGEGPPAAAWDGVDSLPEGSDRASRRRTAWWVALAAGLVAAVLLIPFARQATEAAPATVAIFPFSLHGSPDFGYLTEGMVDLLSTNLEGAAGLRTVDPRAVIALAERAGEPVASPADARALADGLGASMYVLGDIAEAGSRLRISAALYDARAAEPVSRAYAEGVADSLFAVVDRLTQLLLAERAQRVGGRLGRTAALTTSSIPALKAYLEGEQHWRAMRLVEAVDALRRATQQDTTFALAWYRLGMASSWDARVDVALDAMERAVRNSAALSERDRTLIAAYHDVVRRDPDEAERRYRAVVASHPADVEAWAGLGEMWFHANPWRGRSFAESRAAWEHVLRLEPRNLGAAWHLAYVGAREQRREEVDSLTRRIEATVAGAPDLSIRAIRAVVLGGEPDRDAVLRDLAGADDFSLILAVWRVAVSTEDLALILRFADLLVDRRRPAEVRALGHGLRAHLRLGRGQWSAAQDELAALARIDPVLALEYGALFATFPLRAAPPTEIATMLQRLRAWSAAVAPRLTSVADLWVNVHADAHPILRAYLTGLASVRAGDHGAAERSVALLEGRAGDSDADRLAQALARELRVELLLERGRAGPALALLDSWRDRVDYGSARTSPFFARSRLRFIRAELLRARGRASEALGWYDGIGEIYPHDVVYLAPASLRSATIHAERGEHRAAAADYRRFLKLWRECDPEFRPLIDQAERRLAALPAG
jgi:DNA-binding SARP family transcriptional activator/tetratricopeptide (TPR) repeat protein